ncbi:hypothetical protein NT26_p10362 (plasmid) [Pseudorhizobium banfieldiae]|uniref:Uncharacterized protein n=1 Tax=Pseudorhizobium banfieldiae TaxID=1125847 RepID=L0NM59_9HYPH|nr:protein of unknown function [Pseudorhizobium banfieldiae]CCF22381.1 hypothetical protein NT26_p10362 [Pseudorhizobium banfieldiae]
MLAIFTAKLTKSIYKKKNLTIGDSIHEPAKMAANIKADKPSRRAFRVPLNRKRSTLSED